MSPVASCPTHTIHLLIAVLLALAAIYVHVPATAIIVVPNSNCYTFDNESRLIDFTHLVGKEYEYNEQGLQRSDLVVEFCKDVQKRSQEGYIEFGRFVSSRSFLFGSGPTDYIQRFHNGDLVHCETTFKMMGRTAQVNIKCGHCSNKACRDEQGCICSISYDERMCRVLVELAIPCSKSGPRVFKGFTVGFHPRSSEIVYNGLTQLGFEQLHHGFSFQTEQIHVSLYLSAMSSLAGLVGKPTLKVNPAKGLSVTLTGSGLNGAMPTTLSPTVLNVDWRCEIARSSPYEVNILIPVEGYDPIEFTLTKECGYAQEKESDLMKGWATFGIISCIFVILSTLLCCGGFIYKTRVEHLYGLDALPGMAFLSAFLDAVGRPRGYLQADNPSENHASQASWEHTGGTIQAAQRANDRAYGSI
ncbi:hypothetical protein SETIT_5G053400v2 [Setaria italica]|uniref:Uncharacterized protein n=2 Tax=Setaria italica TaxID=4555 RepID=A0A368R1K7_SETIT|nr:uncharacterized protein LOC101779214 [Setaria italica]XP_022682737.1 uncharacterized protein LOC101779214 [Setaria italica]RCV24042.1 hypothetical protein SETIT_5G053400v2 [Setaria italica]